MIKIGGYQVPRYRELDIGWKKQVASESEITLATDRVDKVYIAKLHTIKIRSIMCSQAEVSALAAAVAPDTFAVNYTDLDGTEKSGTFRCESIDATMTNKIGNDNYYTLQYTLEEIIT